MSILLGILKVIGWILLILVLLILALILFVLINAIRYESTGMASRDKIHVRLNVDWLLKLLRIRGAVTNDKILVEVKVLWFSVFRLKKDWKYPPAKGDPSEEKEEEKEATEEKDNKSEAEPEGVDSEDQLTSEFRDDLPDDESGEGASEAEHVPQAHESEGYPEEENTDSDTDSDSDINIGSGEAPRPEDNTPEEQHPCEQPDVPAVHVQPLTAEAPKPEKASEPIPPKKKSKPAEKASPKPESKPKPEPKPKPEAEVPPKPDIDDRFEALRQKLESKTEAIRVKLDQLNRKVEEGKALLSRKDVWDTVNLGRRILIRILKHVLPGECRIHGTVGTGDPALTGQILGLCCILRSLMGKRTDIECHPVFEEKVLRGKYYIKGRIRLGLFVVCGLRLLLNRNIRRLIFRKNKGEEA